MLAEGVASRPARPRPKGPCTGADIEEVENELAAIRVEDEARAPSLLLALLLAVAVCVAGLAAALDLALQAIAEAKLAHVLRLVELDGRQWPAFLVLAALNGSLVAFGAVCVCYLEPCAKGSGIPEVKAYLNGRSIPRVLHWRTVVAKVLGVLGSVGGQLPVGKEGPLIHAGAGAGANRTGALAHVFARSRRVGALVTPAALRDIVSLGCACGVAVAFAAPIGGVLFVLEEAASPHFWHSGLTALTFLAASVASLAVSAIDSLRRALASWSRLRLSTSAPSKA
jgi:chloride channel 7